MELLRAFQRIQRHSVAALTLALLAGWAATALAQGNSRAARFYEDALVRYERKDIAGAIIQLKNAIREDPNSLPVQLLLGKALMQNGDVVAAEVAYREALRLGVDRAEVVIPLGQSFVAQGKHAELLEQQTFSPAGLPGSVQLQVRLLRASAFVDTGNADRALAELQEARRLDSTNPDVWLAEVPVRIRSGQLREAIAAVERAQALAPASAEAHYQAGTIAHVQGDLTRAMAAYDKALAANKDHVEARVARIGIHQDRARFDDAQKDLAELQRVAPNDARGWYLKALLAERRGDSAVVRESLTAVTALLDPLPPNFLRYRPQMLMLNGLAHHGLGQMEKATAHLESFVRIQPQTPVSKLLAQIHLSAGDAGKAIALLEQYLKRQPGDGQAMMFLARAHMASGRPARAATLMEEALKTQDNAAYRTVLGLSLMGIGQLASGIAQLEAAYRKDPTQIQAARALAEAYLRDGQARKAVTIAEAIAKQHPKDATVLNLLGTAQGQAGSVAAAKASFESALKLDANLVVARLNLARLEIAQKQYDPATARLNELLRADERNTEAMGELAIIAERKGQLPEAQRWLEKALATASTRDLRWGLALVEFHLRHKQSSAALDAAKAASGRAPEDFQTLLVHARALLASGDRISARTVLTTATRFGEFSATRQVDVAALQLEAANPAGAIYSLEKALATQPDHLPALALLVEAEFKNGDAAKAEKRARDIIAMRPRSAVGHNLLGMIHLGRGQPSLAVDALRRAHEIEPSTTTVSRLIMAVSGHQGDRAAQSVAEQWLRANPRDAQVRSLLGDIHARQSNYPAAQVAYEEAIRLRPGDVEVINNLANVHLLRGNHAEAIKAGERALALEPGNALVIDTLGWAHHLAGQGDRALALLRDARLRQPGHPEIRYHLAAALAKAGRLSEAREELDAAFKLSNRFAGVKEAEALRRSLQ